MRNNPSRNSSIRDRARGAIRHEIAQVAIQLFVEHGFEGTTTEQIATAAGVSRSTFFRYFATKDEVILSQFEEHGQELAAAVAARPPTEPAWEALHRGFGSTVERRVAAIEAGGTAIRLATLQVYTGTLRAAGLNQRARWRALLAPGIAERLGTDTRQDPRPMALAAAAIGCLESAVVAWAESDGRRDLVELLDSTMTALGPS